MTRWGFAAIAAVEIKAPFQLRYPGCENAHLLLQSSVLLLQSSDYVIAIVHADDIATARGKFPQEINGLPGQLQ